MCSNNNKIYIITPLQEPSPKLQQIKKEEIKIEKSEEDIKYESLSDPENTDLEDQSNDDEEELQLVEGVKVGEKKKKIKKEKPDDLKKKLELEEVCYLLIMFKINKSKAVVSSFQPPALDIGLLFCSPTQSILCDSHSRSSGHTCVIVQVVCLKNNSLAQLFCTQMKNLIKYT